MVAVAPDARADERSANEVAAMMTPGLIAVSPLEPKSLQRDAVRATRMVLRHRLDCARLIAVDYPPAARRAEGGLAFRVTCAADAGSGGTVDFLVDRSEMDRGPAVIRRELASPDGRQQVAETREAPRR